MPPLANPRYEAFAQARAKGGPAATLGALLRIVKAGDGSESPTLVKEARLAILDITRLHREAKYERSDGRKEIAKDYNYSNKGRAKENETDYP